MGIRSQAVIARILVLTAFAGTAIAQQSKTPTKWEVAQLASDMSPSKISVDASDVNIRSGPRLKFRREVRNARLAKWSPDGRKLAFLTTCQASDPDNDNVLPTLHCLGVANADASHRLRLTGHPKKVFKDWLSVINFAWSPSGEEIAYIERSDSNWTILSVVRPDGSGLKEIHRLKCMVVGATLNWSPDGQSLALTGCSDEQPTVLVVDRTTGDSRSVLDARDPIWSPDGKMLLFRKTASPGNKVVALSIVNVDGTQERKILDGEQAEFGLAWLPNGRSIAFGSMRDQSRLSEIFRIDVDGTKLQKVASDSRRNLSLASPIFAPDGQKLIVVADSAPDKLRDVLLPEWRGVWLHTVWLIDVATGDKQLLAGGSYPDVVWSRK